MCEKGRQLKSFDDISFTYNANGIRTSKTVDGINHTYTLDGTKILREEWENNVLETIFDNEDTVCGIVYNGVPYYFHKNLQGDIIAIANSNGTVVARYSYDAWGKCTIEQDYSLNGSVATVNPYRYRGYYYDKETELYYLQSRYYDADVGRFVNGDDHRFLGVNSKIIGFNLFAYCNNHCVNNTDYNGNFIAQIICALIGAMLGAASYLVGFFIEKYILKNKVSFNVWLLSVGIIVGAIDGILSSSAKISKLLSFVIAFLVDFVSSIVGGDTIYEAMICAFLVAIITLCLSGGNMLNPKTITKYNNQLIKKLKKNNWKIIKQGVKTFFKKMKNYLKKYMTNSAIIAVIGTGSHISSKVILKAMKI